MQSTDNSPSELVEAQAEQWLVRLDGAPDDAQLRQQFERWYNQHPAHAEAFANAELLWQMLSGLEPPALPAEPVRQHTSRRHIYASAAVVLMAAGLLMLPQWHSPQYKTGAAEQQQATLEDGSELELNSQTQLNTHFSPTLRQLDLLRGEAEFTVAQDGRPFIVNTDQLSVRALGTVFTVGQYGNRQWVNVAESKVEVCQAQHCKVVRAGQQLELKEGQLSPVSPARPAQVSAWKRGLVIAENQPVQSLLDELERYYPGQIVLLADGLEQRRLNTVLNIRKPVQALQSLARSLSLQVKVVGPLAFLY